MGDFFSYSCQNWSFSTVSAASELHFAEVFTRFHCDTVFVLRDLNRWDQVAGCRVWITKAENFAFHGVQAIDATINAGQNRWNGSR